MNADIYTDGAINIAVVNGMIRINFGVLSVTNKDEADNPAFETTHRLVMTPQGFIKTFGNMEAVLNKLVEAGIIVDSSEELRSGPARDVRYSFSGQERRTDSRERRQRDLKVRK